MQISWNNYVKYAKYAIKYAIKYAKKYAKNNITK